LDVLYGFSFFDVWFFGSCQYDFFCGKGGGHAMVKNNMTTGYGGKVLWFYSVFYFEWTGPKNPVQLYRGREYKLHTTKIMRGHEYHM
jgi:hypothetical protein